MHKACYQRIKGNLLRPNIMRRLHLFPDDVSIFHVKYNNVKEK